MGMLKPTFHAAVKNWLQSRRHDVEEVVGVKSEIHLSDDRWIENYVILYRDSDGVHKTFTKIDTNFYEFMTLVDGYS